MRNQIFVYLYLMNIECYTEIIMEKREFMSTQEVMERMQRDGADIVFQYDGLESGVTLELKDGFYELTAWNGAWYRSYDSFEDAFTDTGIFREGLGTLIDEGKIEISFE